MADKYMRKCSPSIAIKEMKIQTTLNLHLTQVRMDIMMKRKKMLMRKWGKEHFYTVIGNANNG
jgi:hypothetical protein